MFDGFHEFSSVKLFKITIKGHASGKIVIKYNYYSSVSSHLRFKCYNYLG